MVVPRVDGRQAREARAGVDEKVGVAARYVSSIPSPVLDGVHENQTERLLPSFSPSSCVAAVVSTASDPLSPPSVCAFANASLAGAGTNAHVSVPLHARHESTLIRYVVPALAANSTLLSDPESSSSDAKLLPLKA